MKKTPEEIVTEKKSPEKSIDVKSSGSALNNEKDETTTVSQTRKLIKYICLPNVAQNQENRFHRHDLCLGEENATKSGTNSIRRRKKKDKASKKEPTNSSKRKPRRKPGKKMLNTTLAGEKQDAAQAAQQPASKSTRTHRSNAAISIPNKNVIRTGHSS